MEFKKGDFKLLRDINGKQFLGLRRNYFDDKAPIGEPLNMEEVAEALADAVEEVIEEAIPDPTPEELAEIEKQQKIAELEAALAEAKGE